LAQKRLGLGLSLTWEVIPLFWMIFKTQHGPPKLVS